MTVNINKVHSSDSPTMIASPALSSTSSSIASTNSPVFSSQSIHSPNSGAAFTRFDQQEQQQQLYSKKRNFGKFDKYSSYTYV